ncbi:MAG: ABC transporter permease [Candidatus Cloacimonetes bacterium HGW-Cloacimonetes-1]|jgi:ABC-2 type transport system permease protein|nr:MAG: ABC transporter permease [Candidatus Cloacimonetes bacterium HGW-Cloacimonetes-1]
MNRRIPAIMLKEVNHILRDSRTLMIVILMPIMQLVIFGYAMNMEIRGIRIGVYDYRDSALSRELVHKFAATESFQISYPQKPIGEMNRYFYQRAFHAFLIIPADFDHTMVRQNQAEVQLIIDASDPNAATMIQNYSFAVVNMFNDAERLLPIRVKTNILYNPDLKSAYFFVPGLIAMILVMISALLTSIAISKEKELGTMEQILVSPIKAHEIIIGKVLPYILLALIDAMLVLLIGKYLFKVPFVGSFPVFLAFTMLYVIVALSLGLLISTIARSQQAAMMMAITMTMLPTMMLSGFMFPIASMPKALQLITRFVPARYYLQIIRGIMLKGNGFAQLMQPGLALILMAAVLLILAIKRFSLRLK